jgi:hypothetical protein
MGSQDFQRIKFGNPPVAAPTANATVVLFDSTKHLPGGLSQNGIGRIQISFIGLDQASAAGGLIGYSSPDKGTTWYPFKFGGTTLPATVAADTGADHSAYDIFVGTEEDVKFTFTAGATPPTVWTPMVFGQVGNVHSGT